MTASRIAVCALASALAAVSSLAAGSGPAHAQNAGPSNEIANNPDFAMSFEERRTKWVRRAKSGPIKFDFKIRAVKSYDAAGPDLVKPQKGDLFVYVNTGNQNWGPVTRPNENNTNKYSRVNVINAKTKKLVASTEMTDLEGFSHFTAVSPDGRYSYVAGGGSYSAPAKAVFWKVDARTLKPIKMFTIGGTVHHMQVFRDKYMLVDTFAMTEEAGSDKGVFLMDPKTDEIVGGVRTEDLGGDVYTAWAGPTPEHKYIYLLMEPKMPKGTGASANFYKGKLMTLPTYWVAVLDPDTWEIVREYPYPAFRSDWVAFSPDGKFMYVNGYIDDKLVKMDLASGKLVWGTDVGTGPYGIEVSADGKQVWTTDKGESGKAHKGRTYTVVSADKGDFLDTVVPGGRGIDHIQLSPDGKEMWGTSNDSGTVYVVDMQTRQTTAMIPLPDFGDAHGPAFVYYDSADKARVVADQGDFHGGIDPRNGKSLTLE